jgi:Tfp pilus assembly protein PilV
VASSFLWGLADNCQPINFSQNPSDSAEKAASWSDNCSLAAGRVRETNSWRIKFDMILRIENATRKGNEAAFALAEALIALVVLALMVLTLYGGVTSGFATVQLAREDMRATQILTERMEVIRLCNWDQITSNGFIPSTFTVPYKIGGATNGTALVYNGTVTIRSIPPGLISTDYAKDMRSVTAGLSWNSGSQTRSRQITTYVSRYGIQNYIYH